MTTSDTELVERKGYIAGLMGQPSLPATTNETDRRAYEGGYDIGRAARLQEQDTDNGC